MKYIDEFRDPALARRLVEGIRREAIHPVRLMEFCGGHTHMIFRFGLRQMLAPHVILHSGPGCPVCVTSAGDLDHAIALAGIPNTIMAIFGDMLRVPGSRDSLQEASARGADVRVVYSPLDALEIARQNPGQQIIFLGVGFETTAPTIAASLVQAEKEGLPNFSFFCVHKLTPPATTASDTLWPKTALLFTLRSVTVINSVSTPSAAAASLPAVSFNAHTVVGE